jgi:hypothetical protein
MNKATDPVTPRTRLQVLDPFIVELHDALGAPAREGPDGETVCLCVSGRELTVDSWTSERMDPRSASGDRLLAECCRVVTQSVALLAKCARDLEALEGQGARGGGQGELDGLRSELMLDAAIGGSLVRDVQAIIDEMLKSGQVEEAGHLSKFLHNLRHTVYELRKQVTPEYRLTVETLAEQLSDSALEAELDDAVTEAVDPEKAAARRQAAEAAAKAPPPVADPEPSPIRHRPLPGAPESPEARARGEVVPVTPTELRDLAEPEPSNGWLSRTAVLAVVLIVACLCLIALRGGSSSALPRSAATELAEPALKDVLLLVEANAPDLNVTVDGSAWRRLPLDRQTALMQELTGVPGAARYEKVLVRDAEDKLLTSWTVPEKEPPPVSRAKAKGRAAPPPVESPGDAAKREFERALAVPGKRGTRADGQGR